jgi:hypothetical protein
MEGVMSHIRQSLAVLTFAIAGLLGCAHEPPVVTGTNQANLTETKAMMRNLWTGHIFWIRNVVVDNATGNPAAREIAEKEVVANAKQIASTLSPFYGELASEKLFTLLADHYAAITEYADATVVGNAPQQDAALAHLASNADDIAVFLSGANPYLSKDSVRGLIAAHGSHHVAQINQLQEHDYDSEAQTWKVMRKHVDVIADTLTTALAKQFPARFS